MKNGSLAVEKRIVFSTRPTLDKNVPKMPPAPPKMPGCRQFWWAGQGRWVDGGRVVRLLRHFMPANQFVNSIRYVHGLIALYCLPHLLFAGTKKRHIICPPPSSLLSFERHAAYGLGASASASGDMPNQVGGRYLLITVLVFVLDGSAFV